MDGFTKILGGGEIGDALFLWPTAKALGGAHIFNANRSWYRPDWVGRSKSLSRLADQQDYIKSYQPHQGEPCDIDLTTYRNGGSRLGERIPDRIARWARVKINTEEPWIAVEPSSETKGRIVINRAPRWVGICFPWKEIVQTFQRELLFIGNDDEYKTFCASFGFVERLRTADHLEAAQAINGSELFIGAQSSCYALSEAMKHPSVLEVCVTSPDVIWNRPNLTHYIHGILSFEACGKKFEAEGIPPKLDRNLPPNGGYRITIGTKTLQSWDYYQLEAMARTESIVQQESHSLEEIRTMIERDSFRPIPSNIPRLKAA